MLSESMKHDKFSINVGAVVRESESEGENVDFNSQFSKIHEIQRYRLKGPAPVINEEKAGLLAATAGGPSSTGSTENIISSPLAPSIRSRIPTNRIFLNVLSNNEVIYAFFFLF